MAASGAGGDAGAEGVDGAGGSGGAAGASGGADTLFAANVGIAVRVTCARSVGFAAEAAPTESARSRAAGVGAASAAMLFPAGISAATGLAAVDSGTVAGGIDRGAGCCSRTCQATPTARTSTAADAMATGQRGRRFTGVARVAWARTAASRDASGSTLGRRAYSAASSRSSGRSSSLGGGVVWFMSFGNEFADPGHGIAKPRFCGFTAHTGDGGDVLQGKFVLHAQHESGALFIRQAFDGALHAPA